MAKMSSVTTMARRLMVFSMILGLIAAGLLLRHTRQGHLTFDDLLVPIGILFFALLHLFFRRKG